MGFLLQSHPGELWAEWLQTHCGGFPQVSTAGMPQGQFGLIKDVNSLGMLVGRQGKGVLRLLCSAAQGVQDKAGTGVGKCGSGTAESSCG